MTTVARRRASQQACAAAAQVVLLALLTAVTGLGPVAWAAGLLHAAALWAVLDTAARRAGPGSLGPADLVTLARAALVGGVLALVVDGSGPGPVVALASVALLLDAVDGPVARRTGTASALGARFDMEVDAFLLLVLSAAAAARLGPWVLAIGLLRYAWVAAGRVLPWLRGELPVRRSAKVVAAVQGIVLVAAVAGAPAWVVAVSLAMLVWSFGRSAEFLWRAR